MTVGAVRAVQCTWNPIAGPLQEQCNCGTIFQPPNATLKMPELGRMLQEIAISECQWPQVSWGSSEWKTSITTQRVIEKPHNSLLLCWPLTWISPKAINKSSGSLFHGSSLREDFFRLQCVPIGEVAWSSLLGLASYPNTHQLSETWTFFFYCIISTPSVTKVLQNTGTFPRQITIPTEEGYLRIKWIDPWRRVFNTR